MPKKAKASKPKRLTIGMRANFKAGSRLAKEYGCEEANNEVLLKERSGGAFAVIILGQKELKKKDPKTVINELAWVNEKDLEFVDANLNKNMNFIDWYEEHEEDFCGDCGAWFPEQGALDPETDEDCVCPNESCPGRLHDSGHCPCCSNPPEKMVKFNDEDECPECGFNAQERW